MKLREMSSKASLSSGPRDESQTANPGDVVATWELRLNDGPHKVTFEHGTTSGKRVILIDGKEVQYKTYFGLNFNFTVYLRLSRIV